MGVSSRISKERGNADRIREQREWLTKGSESKSGWKEGNKVNFASQVSNKRFWQNNCEWGDEMNELDVWIGGGRMNFCLLKCHHH